MKKVLMIGMYGVYNYGCEAIARGCVEILKKKYEDVEIHYATPNPEDDSIRLKDCTLIVTKRLFKTKNMSNLVRKIANLIGTDHPALIEDTSLFSGYDAVYSIGGDIYTVDKDGRAPLSFMRYANECMFSGIPYYMLCSSIGPFNDDKWLASFIKPHMKKITRIYARENNTINYLKSIGIEDNVSLLTDPAFFVEGPKKRACDKWKLENVKRIGINLSPLSSLHYFKTIDECLLEHISIIESILKRNEQYTVSLIPHVYSSDINDDDFRYMAAIYNRLEKKYKDRIVLENEDVGFIGRKSQLINCDLVFAARMHCAINAICCGVRTIFLSYSQKSVGMSELLYGTSKYAVPLNEFANIEDLFKLASTVPSALKRIEAITDISFEGDIPKVQL
ncbi:TPA: polysaccharide pyruvyl transferase family protein [Vibrio vulnificus]|nr:polysaccharide pyruvyl transferase family protein [Vibrio vulnificus]